MLGLSNPNWASGGPLSVNRSHFAARNLLEWITPNDGRAVRVGTVKLTSQQRAKGAPMQSAGGNGSFYLYKPLSGITQNCSVLLICNNFSSGTSAAGGIGTSTGGNQGFVYQQSGNPNRAVIRAASGGGITTADFAAASTSDLDVLLMVYDGTSALKIFRNGANLGTSNGSTGATGAVSGFDRLVLGAWLRGASLISNTGQSASLVAAWNVAWPSDAAIALTANPEPLFAPSRQLWGFSTAVGGTTFTATLTASQSSSASRIAAAQAIKAITQASTSSKQAVASSTRTATQGSTGSKQAVASSTRTATQGSTGSKVAQARSVKTAAQASTPLTIKAVAAIKTVTQASTATWNRVWSQVLTATQASAASIANTVIPAGTLVFNWIVHWTRRGRRKR